MAKTIPDKSVKDKVIEAALALAAEEGWSEVTYDQILMAAGVEALTAQEYFDDKTDILIAYGRRVDVRMIANAPNAEDGVETRDILFDVLMERFDIVNEDRAALVSILNSFKSDPKQAVISLPHLGRSMGKVMTLAGIETEGVSGVVKVSAMVAAYLYVVRTWKDDDSADMGKTMAALDKALDHAESAANSFDGGLFSALGGFMNDARDKFSHKS